MIEAGGNTEPTVDARIVFCRHVWNAVRFQKGDELIAPDIKKDVAKVPALFNLYRIGDDRFEPQNAFVELSGLVEVECRETNVGKSSMAHGLLLVFTFLATVVRVFCGAQRLLALSLFIGC